MRDREQSPVRRYGDVFGIRKPVRHLVQELEPWPCRRTIASRMKAVYPQVSPVEIDHREVMSAKPCDARARREPLPTRDREGLEAGEVRVVQHRALGYVRQDQA